MAPDLEAFRALARSSPWAWRTLRLRVRWRHDTVHVGGRSAVRAWVDGSWGLRVEDLEGALLSASWQHPGPSTSGPRQPRTPGQPGFPAPERRPDGLVARLPHGFDLTYDRPMWQTYQWVAMLAPLELADGAPLGSWPPSPEHAPVELAPGTSVRVVDHHGREAWEADLVPTAAYEPRCSCCPLMPCPASDAREVAAGARPSTARWGDHHRVRLDAATGVVVELEQHGGDAHGRGATAVLEAVDEDLPRRLFDARHLER